MQTDRTRKTERQITRCLTREGKTCKEEQDQLYMLYPLKESCIVRSVMGKKVNGDHFNCEAKV